MNYLSPSEYETYGLEATTPAAWVLAASTVIDAHCRRATLGVAQYDERLRIAAGRNTVRVTYVPLASEIDLAYTAGLAVIPDTVKVACAQIVRNAQSTPALNVRSGRIDRMHLDYFSDTLVDQTVRSLLAPYVAQKVG